MHKHVADALGRACNEGANRAYMPSFLRAAICAPTKRQLRFFAEWWKTHRGYFWVYYDPLRKIVLFDYRKSRSAKGPSDFLGNFNGILQVDGYAGCDEVIARNAIQRAACMDHCRRRFEKAKDYDAARAKHALDTMRIW